MDWKDIGNTCFKAEFRETENAKLEAAFIEFWPKFCTDVLGRNAVKSITWDYLYVSVRGPDGYIQIWPQELNQPPKKAYWAALHIFKLGSTYYELEEEEFETKGQELEESLAKMLVSAAESVHLDELAGSFEGGLKIRFHTYDEEEPFFEAVIGGEAKD